MKHLFAIISLMLFILAGLSCNKNDNNNYMAEGVLTGYDVRDCACCGGLLINLNSNDTALYTDSTYQIYLIPKDFDINVGSDFPIFIRLDYERNDKLCGKTIDILRFERR